MYAYTDAERAKEEWRHRECAKYLRQQFESQPRGRHRDPAEYYAAGGVPIRAADPMPPAETFQAPPPTAALQREPTQHDKVWKVFEYLDTNKDFRVDSTEWKAGIQACRVPFNEPTIDDLFEKGASSTPDGITSSDWSGFARRYPMLVDCLYYRFVSAHSAEAEIRQADEAAPALTAAVRRAGNDEDQAKRDLEAEMEVVAREADALRDAEGKRADAEAQHKQRQEGAAAAAKVRGDAQRTVQQQWPEIQRRNAESLQAQRELDQAKRRIAEGNDREKRLRQALAELQEDRDRAMQEQAKAEDTLARLKAESQPDPEEELARADKDLVDSQRQEREAAVELTEAAQLAERQRFRRDEAERRANAAQNHADDRARAHEAARKAELANEKKKQQAENIKRLGPGMESEGVYTEAAEKENTYVTEEIKLRQQRDELERRENVLREVHDTFTSPRQAAGSSSPLRDHPAYGSPSPPSFGR